MNPFWTNLVIDVLLVIFVIDCAFMGLVIMMQRSKQEGLGAAFGSGVMSDTFGAQTSNVLVKATVYAAIIFFAISLLLARLYSHRASLMDEASPLQQMLAQPVTPAKTTPAPAPSAALPAPSSGAAPAPVAPTSTAPSTKPTAAPAPKQ